jgi:ATP-binding cassette subfamily B (MDR/TAP) protein 1
MGDGLVLEYGNHNELLQRDGAYARLVQAQKLREGKERRPGDALADGSDDDEESVEDMEKAAREEIPLGRKNTSQSLASEILAQRRKAAEESGEKEVDYSMPYLFKRMAPLIRDQWKNYIFGAIFASSEWLAGRGVCFFH